MQNNGSELIGIAENQIIVPLQPIVRMFSELSCGSSFSARPSSRHGRGKWSASALGFQCVPISESTATRLGTTILHYHWPPIHRSLVDGPADTA